MNTGRNLAVPAKPLPLEAVPPPKRDRDVPDVLWELPTRLVEVGKTYDLTQKSAADAAGVSQPTISRWLNYRGLTTIAAWPLIQIEQTLGLPHGYLTRPLGAVVPSAEFVTAKLRQRLARLGVDKSMLILTEDGRSEQSEAVMLGFPEEARRAVVGIVHVLGYPLDQVVPIAEEVVSDSKTSDRTAEEWFVAIRIRLPPRPRSGTHLAIKRAT